MKYKNTILGDENTVKGKSNIVLGDKNTLEGNKNWVFSKSYKGNYDRVLIVDKWKIFLDKIESIKAEPKIAIVKWKE